MPEKMTLHFKDGSSTAMDAIDARRVLREHGGEWSTTPFPADVRKAAQEEAEGLRLHLSKLRAERKSEAEIEDARVAWPDTWKAMQAGKTAGKPQADAKPYEAKHRGGGSYSIMNAEGKEVLDKLSKDDAELFNTSALDAQESFIEAEKAKRG